MSLENLLKIGRLKEHTPDAEEIQRLLAAAKRNLADARVKAISAETRFDAAYKAVMQTALGALMAHGYRPDTKSPGHHVTVVQGLVHTIGLDAARVRVLDTLRRVRNVSDYSGEDIAESSAEECIKEADRLHADVMSWLRANRPKLAPPK